MKTPVMIGLAVAMLAACAPMNTSSTASMATTGSPTSGTSGSSDDALSGTSTASSSAAGTSAAATTAISLPTPTVAASAPVNNGTGYQSGTFPMTKQPSAPSGLNPTGSLAITATGDQTKSVVTLSGLAPNTYYVAHYHNQGAASADPCTSGGPLIKASMIVGQSDGTGSLTLTGTVDANNIKSATYFNVHTASDASGTPADAGVICTPVH